jgi:uncharacterized protein (TIGR02271 family)
MTDGTDDSERIVPVVDEDLVAKKRQVKTGSVRVQKYVDQRVEKVSMPLLRETVDVRRVPVNRVVESIPEMRTVGDTTIIPVVEEELVVTKRLVLKEEIHLIKRRTRESETQDVTLEKERAEVMRMDAEGRVVEAHKNKQPEPADFKIGRRRSILGE